MGIDFLNFFKPAYILSLMLLMLQSCNQQRTEKKQNSDWKLAEIPTREEVGADQLTDDIAPVNAPFETIQFQKPSFPLDTVSLKLTKDILNTSKIQQAIDELSASGGGVILVPKGVWKTGRIELKSNINLHLSTNATLTFSGEIEDYLPVVFTRIEGVEVKSLGACIYANNAKNIAITGSGMLVGPEEGSIRENILKSEIKVIEEVIDFDAPVEDRIVNGKQQDWIFPPMFISPINSEQVYIEGISLKNTAFWNIVPIYCNDVIIRGVTINSVGIPRGDGIDVESSKNVLIEYCTLSTGDDCFTMKSGRGHDGLRVGKPTENVVVRNCLALRGHGGITCGSETAGMIKNLYVHDCVFLNSRVGIRFKTRRPRGGGGDNLTFERILLSDQHQAIKFDMLGSRTYVGKLADRLPELEVNELTPKYSNINIRDIKVEKTSTFLDATGIPESPIENVTIEKAEISSEKLISIQDMDGLHLKDLDFSNEDSTLSFLDVRNVTFENVTFKKPVSIIAGGTKNGNILIKSSENIEIKENSEVK